MLANDNELLGKYLHANDDEAFVELVRRHSTMVLAVCNGMLLDRHDAEDAFQATFLVLSIKANKLLDRGSVAGWLYHVAIRNCLEIRRKKGRGKEIPMNQEPPVNAPEPWTEISNTQEYDLIHQEINRLPQKYREVIVLCHLEGHTRSQAAEFLDWTEAAVKAALARARNMLRRRLVRRGIVVTSLLVMLQATRVSAANTVNDSLLTATLEICKGQKPSVDVGTGPSSVQSLATQGAINMSSMFKAVMVSSIIVAAIAIPLSIFAQNTKLDSEPIQTISVDALDNQDAVAETANVSVETSKSTKNTTAVSEPIVSREIQKQSKLNPFSTQDSKKYWELMRQAYQMRISSLREKQSAAKDKSLVIDAMAQQIELEAKMLEATLHLKRIEAGVSLSQSNVNSTRPTVPGTSFAGTVKIPPASTVSVEPGDELIVEFVNQAAFSPRRVVVQADHTIAIPLAGTVVVKGLSPEQIGKLLEKDMAKYLKDPMVFVTRSDASSPLSNSTQSSR